MSRIENHNIQTDCDDELYKGIGDFHFDRELIKLEERNKEYSQLIIKLNEALNQHKEKIKELQNVNDTLTLNISVLLKTAKTEIERKQKIIDDLRKRLENINGQKYNSSQNKKFTNDQFKEKSCSCNCSVFDPFEENRNSISIEGSSSNNNVQCTPDMHSLSANNPKCSSGASDNQANFDQRKGSDRRDVSVNTDGPHRREAFDRKDFFKGSSSNNNIQCTPDMQSHSANNPKCTSGSSGKHYFGNNNVQCTPHLHSLSANIPKCTPGASDNQSNFDQRKGSDRRDVSVNTDGSYRREACDRKDSTVVREVSDIKNGFRKEGSDKREGFSRKETFDRRENSDRTDGFGSREEYGRREGSGKRESCDRRDGSDRRDGYMRREGFARLETNDRREGKDTRTDGNIHSSSELSFKVSKIDFHSAKKDENSKHSNVSLIPKDLPQCGESTSNVVGNSKKPDVAEQKNINNKMDCGKTVAQSRVNAEKQDDCKENRTCKKINIEQYYQKSFERQMKNDPRTKPSPVNEISVGVTTSNTFPTRTDTILEGTEDVGVSGMRDIEETYSTIKPAQKSQWNKPEIIPKTLYSRRMEAKLLKQLLFETNAEKVNPCSGVERKSVPEVSPVEAKKQNEVTANVEKCAATANQDEKIDSDVDIEIIKVFDKRKVSASQKAAPINESEKDCAQPAVPDKKAAELEKSKTQLNVAGNDPASNTGTNRIIGIKEFTPLKENYKLYLLSPAKQAHTQHVLDYYRPKYPAEKKSEPKIINTSNTDAEKSKPEALNDNAKEGESRENVVEEQDAVKSSENECVVKDTSNSEISRSEINEMASENVANKSLGENSAAYENKSDDTLNSTSEIPYSLRDRSNPTRYLDMSSSVKYNKHYLRRRKHKYSTSASDDNWSPNKNKRHRKNYFVDDSETVNNYNSAENLSSADLSPVLPLSSNIIDPKTDESVSPIKKPGDNSKYVLRNYLMQTMGYESYFTDDSGSESGEYSDSGASAFVDLL